MTPRYALAIACTMLMLSATAQTLTKEITVDKDYVPVQRKATKYNILPTVQKSGADLNSKIDYSDWAMPAAVPAKIPTMLPYGYLTDKAFSASRGYVDLAAGSQLNIIASAGYNIVQSDNTTLALWAQHNSTWAGKNSTPWTKVTPPDTKEKQKYNDNTITARLESRFSEGILRVGASANFDIFNYYGAQSIAADNLTQPASVYNSLGNQTFTHFGINAAWDGHRKDRDLGYCVKLAIDNGGFDKTIYSNFKALKETAFSFGAGFDYRLRDGVRAGVRANFDYSTYGDAPLLSPEDGTAAEIEQKGRGIFTVSPFISFEKERLSLSLGAALAISIHDGTTFRAAPNIRAQYQFAPGASFYANITGGKQLNYLWAMKQANRYFNPNNRYGSTYSPVDLEAGFSLGSFGGFAARLYGGFASYKGLQLPTAPALIAAPDDGTPCTADVTRYNDAQLATTTYDAIDLSGWKAGAELSYQYRSIVEASISFAYAPQKEDQGYMLAGMQDRAKYSVDATLRLRPIAKLAVTVGYQLRGKRAVWSRTVTNDNEQWSDIAMSDINNLQAGASYQITPRFNAFVQADNLLNKVWQNHLGLGAQRLNVVGGVGYTF